MWFTILLGVISLIIIYIIFYKKEKDKCKEINEKECAYEYGILCVLIFLFALGMVFVFSWSIFSSIQNKEFVEVESIEIYSITNDSQINGNFALGSGTINEKMYYIYYKQGENGGYIIDKIQSDNIEIIEMEGEEEVGYIKKYEEKLEHSSWYWGIGDTPIEQKKRVVIYVPKGTIKISFDIDLLNVV